MKGIDLSNYALEDLLSFDDIFLDYFNNFLKNSAFPQTVQYNRFLGIFEEITPPQNAIIVADRLPKRTTVLSSVDHATSFSSNETEQNKIFDWVRKERLPLFFRTNLFREFKLCKLLARPLDEERHDSIASSQCIGGYSRQSPPNSNTLSTEAAEDRLTAGGADGDGQNDENAISPSMYFPHLEKLNKYLFQRPGSRAFSVPAYFPFFTSNKLSIGKSGSKKNDKRPPTVSVESSSKNTKDSKESTKLALNLKAVLNGDKVDLKRQDNIEDLTKIDLTTTKSSKSKTDKLKGILTNRNGENKSVKIKKQTESSYRDTYDDAFDDDDDDDDDDDYPNGDYDPSKTGYNDDFDFDYEEDEDTENAAGPNDDQLSINDDVIDDIIESDNVHASINQYKLKYLGSVRGMNEFREFLKQTAEGDRFIKFWLDCEFYRDSMQDYDQIENMATRNRLFRDINEKYIFPFSNKVHEKIKENYSDQYGLNHQVFVRIQYDILRRLRSYWVPRFIINRLRNSGKNYGSYPLPPLTPEYSRQSTYNTVPSTVKSMSVSQKIRTLDSNTVLNEAQRKVLYDKVKQALCVDKEAGGPFLRFVSINYPDYLALVLFWYDVLDFNESYTNRCDKNSRMQHAWAIYNSYLSPTSRFNVGSPSETTEIIRKTLQSLASSNSNADIDVNIFHDVTEQLVTCLETPWLEYIKDDIMKYTEARLQQLDLSRAGEEADNIQEKIPDPDIEINDKTIYVYRPWVRRFLAGKPLEPEVPVAKPKVQLTPEQKAERARRLKIMEIERRKALRAAKKRLKLRKLGTPSLEEMMEIPEVNEGINDNSQSFNQSSDRGEKVQSRRASTFQSDKSLFFDKMLSTNKSMMQLLRKFLVDSSQRDALNKFNFYLDAKQYMETPELNKKQTMAINIQKTYLDPNSKRNVLPLNEKLQVRLTADLHAENRGNNRPRTPFMIAATREYRPVLEEEYQKFCEIQAKDLGMSTPDDFAALSQAELLVLLGDTYNAKDFDFDDEKGEGKQLPSKEDRAEFLKLLMDWSQGKVDGRFYGYYAHLTEHGKKDGLPFLDKDLLFCIDSIRIKEISGEEVLKQKCQVILDVYLDSLVPPAIQIDINHETHQKLIKSLAKIMQSTHSNSDFVPFDDAKAILFKDLLPYWSGFKHSYKPSQSVPLTKSEKIVKERLDEFIAVRGTPQIDFKLPPLPSGRRKDHHHHANTSLQITFSLATGIKFKDEKITNLQNVPPTATNSTNVA